MIVTKASVLATRRATIDRSIAAFVPDPDSEVVGRTLNVARAKTCKHGRFSCSPWCGVRRAEADRWRVIPREERHADFAAWVARCEADLAEFAQQPDFRNVWPDDEPAVESPVDPEIGAVATKLRSAALAAESGVSEIRTHGWYIMLRRPLTRRLASVGWAFRARNLRAPVAKRTKPTQKEVVALRQILNVLIGRTYGPSFLCAMGFGDCKWKHAAVYRLRFQDEPDEREDSLSDFFFPLEVCADCVVEFQNRKRRFTMTLVDEEPIRFWRWAFTDCQVFEEAEKAAEAAAWAVEASRIDWAC